MNYGIILSDKWNQYNDYRRGILRNISSHRLASFLREHSVEVDVVDFLHEFSREEICEAITASVSNGLSFLAIDTSYDKRYQYWDYIVAYTRSISPNTKIIVFGERVHRLGYTNADFYIEGFAESAFLKVLNNELSGNTTIHTNNYPNDFTKNTFAVKYLDSDFVTSNENKSIMFSQGCIFNCSFCNHSAVGVRKSLNQRPKEFIIDEILDAYTRHGITKFIMTDSTFNDSEEKTEILLEALEQIPEPVKFVCFLRLDLLYHQKGLLDKLVDAGLVAIHFGIDSWHPATGKKIGKTLDPDTLKQYLIEIKTKYPDLFIYGSFIAGLPNDTVEQQWESLTWLRTHPVMDMWYWFPLSIKSDTGSGEVLSQIEKDYVKFGYQNLNNSTSIEAVGRGSRDKNISVVHWKNDSFSLSTAVDLCKKINYSSHRQVKTNPWIAFQSAVVFKNIDWWLRATTVEVLSNQEALKKSVNEYVTDYKNKKLDYLTKKCQQKAL